MKMNFKLKALAVVAIMASSAPAFATIAGGVTGNGELLLNVRYYGGDSATTGGDDISALFDLGLKMNDVLAANSSLIDKGTDVGLPYRGRAPDLGAFES